jgi:hypothetical protein
MNRGWGLPRQRVDIEVENDEDVEARAQRIHNMSLEEVERELARLEIRREREEAVKAELPRLVHDAIDQSSSGSKSEITPATTCK